MSQEVTAQTPLDSKIELTESVTGLPVGTQGTLVRHYGNENKSMVHFEEYAFIQVIAYSQMKLVEASQ